MTKATNTFLSSNCKRISIMKKTFIFSAIALIALAACTKEKDIQEPVVPQGETITIVASVDQTKTTESAAVFSWGATETISVGTSDYEYVSFEVSDAATGTFAHTFSGSAPDLLMAVSPAQIAGEVFAGTDCYDVTLPAVYNNYVQGTTNALMIGSPDSQTANKFIFRHAAALLKITYANVPVGTSSFVLEADENITGTVTLDDITADKIEIQNSNGDLSGSEVTINLPQAVTEPNTTLTFYVPVPTGNYELLNIYLANSGGKIDATEKSMDRSGKSPLALARGDVFTFPTITLPKTDYFVKVTSTDDLMNGKYLIVYEGGTNSSNVTVPSVAFKGSLESPDATNNGVAVTINSNKIIATNELKDEAFTISIDDGTILSASGKYIGVGSYTNSIAGSDNADTYTNSFSIDSGNAIIGISFGSSGTCTMRYNYASDQLRFRYYKNGQQPVALYLLNDGTATVPSTHKPSAELSYTETELNVLFEDKDSFTAPTLTNPHDVTVTYSSNNDSVAEVDAGTGVVTIKAVGVATITASFAGDDTYKEGSASYTITVTSSAPVADGTILWQEDFTGYGATMPSTATGSHVYGGGTVSYALTNGSTTTKLYAEAQAGGTAPELFISKSNGAYEINGIPTGNASTMTLFFKSNYGNRCSISSSTSEINVDTPAVSNGCVRVELSVTGSVSSFDLTFADNTSDNVRIDNIILVAGDVQQLVMSEVTCSDPGVNKNSLTFSWTAVSNATGYQVSIDGGSTFGSTITATSYTWSGLDEGTSYNLYVKAIGDGTSYLDSYAVSASGTTKSDTFIYTLSAVKNSSNSAYATYYNVTINGMSWNAPGNQTSNGYWRIGGGKLSSEERIIKANDAIGGDVNTITINTNGKSRDSITLNGITVKAYTDNSFSDTGAVTFTTSDSFTLPKGAEHNITFTKSGTTNVNGYYFKIVFTVTNSTTNNGGVDLTSIVFAE